ncbi:glucose-6-phosphate isomerase [Spirochaetota bacterium]|nr:glucose-6-phosphate isomerase [Spirochaetota bacterium]
MERHISTVKKPLEKSAVITQATWDFLTKKAQQLQRYSLRELYKKNHASTTNATTTQKSSDWSLASEGIYLDYSKNYLDDETLQGLLRALGEAQVEKRRSQMFNGHAINTSEKRAVLHTLLRNPYAAARGEHRELSTIWTKTEASDHFAIKKSSTIGNVGLSSIGEEILAVQKQFLDFADRVRHNVIRSSTGKRFKHVVNIGIGGSYLGCKMTCDALAIYCRGGPEIHFVSNIDGFDLYQTLKKLPIEETLFLIASKTFTTDETMTNAYQARAIIQNQLGKDAISSHFACMSTNTAAVVKFGIRREFCFPFWDFVGGRYSLWSAIGLPVAIALGTEGFKDLLSGAYAMDNHFNSTPSEQNLPIMLGLIHFFYATFMKYPTRAILPYSHRLSSFVEHLQQLEMESNGKSIDLRGSSINYPTAPIVWGCSGTNGQHSFYQLLHQGSTNNKVAVDFIGIKRSELNEARNSDELTKNYDWTLHHQKLNSHLVAQGEALAFGNLEDLDHLEENVKKSLAKQKESAESPKSAESPLLPAEEVSLLLANKSFPGNKPSNLLLVDDLTPRMFGKLVALYEHKVFVEGILWNINSFDQWGVELGKQIFKDVIENLTGKTAPLGRRLSTSAAKTIRLLRPSTH